MRRVNKEIKYIWFVDCGTYYAGPYAKKPPRYDGGKPVRFKLEEDDGVEPTRTTHENELVLEGYSRAMDGKHLVVDLQENGVAQIPVLDKRLRWDMYSKNIKLTIESSGEEN